MFQSEDSVSVNEDIVREIITLSRDLVISEVEWYNLICLYYGWVSLRILYVIVRAIITYR